MVWYNTSRILTLRYQSPFQYVIMHGMVPLEYYIQQTCRWDKIPIAWEMAKMQVLLEHRVELNTNINLAPLLLSGSNNNEDRKWHWLVIFLLSCYTMTVPIHCC